MSYRVDATWDDTGWWVVTVPDVPSAITQARRLELVPADAAEVIEIQTGNPVDPTTLDIHPRLDGDAGTQRRRHGGCAPKRTRSPNAPPPPPGTPLLPCAGAGLRSATSVH